MGAPFHWIILALAALLAAGVGCSRGNDGDSDAPSAPTPLSPAAGTETDPANVDPRDGENDGETSTPSSPAPDSTAAPPGPAAKSATTALIDVKPVTPAELQQLVAQNQGKAVLFDFWATWCVPCVKQYPHTVELSKTHADDLVVFTVSFDETDEESLAAVRDFHAKHGLGKVHPLISKDGGAEESYNGFDITGGALPHYKLFDREGKLAATLGGDVDNPPDAKAVDAAVTQVLDK